MITEKQRINIVWVWGIVIVFNLIALYGCIKQLIFDLPFGTNPAPDGLLVIGFSTTLILLVMLFIMRLKTEITDSSIIVTFYPFTKKEILRSQVKSMEIVRYNPLKDYGGWGIRYGKKGMAYTLGGNLGLSITLLDGKNILIGILNKQKFDPLIT